MSIYKLSFKKLHRVGNDRELYPDRDWKIILIAFFAIIVLIAAGGVFVFLKASSGELFNYEKGRNVISGTVDRNALNEIIKTFDKKEAKFKELKSESRNFIDPSL